MWSARIKRMLGKRLTVAARLRWRRLPVPRWGNLRRTRPFSDSFGFERGSPIDRHYVNRFLEAHRSLITGSVLEIQLTGYTDRFGRGVQEAHTLDINPDFAPTYCCDLAEARTLVPASRYDCFLLPNTLYALTDLEGSLREAYRIVRPGGAILATTATFVPLVPDGADYWRLTEAGWRELAGRVWPAGCFDVTAYGNCLSAAAAMLGLAAEELTDEELDHYSPRYPVLVGIVCRKPGA
jgi:hypothetical protein